jgi:DNA primase
MIPKETVDRIFDTARIDEVVGEFVSLKKRGGNMIGLCPFHNEKTPSFNVSPARGIYKCFGCAKGGNSVNFIMEHEHISYPEALRWLAKKYNIEIEEEEVSSEQQAKDNERESLFLVSAFAQKHFTKNLHETEEGKAIALSYFKERGMRQDIIEKFMLGYSPDVWRDFADAALAAGYKLEYLVKAGLVIQNEEDPSKFFDRFKGRVMFPVHNASGRIIAFGGRTLKTDKKVAKYINSPETEIYHKSNVLYGLYFAKKQIIAEDVCYLVEGYTDVTSMHQAGIENVVASSGTALTVEQIRLIRRYTNNITILYDGDPAGIKASFRGIDLILEEGMNVRVLLFPDNDDPDSYSKKVSSEELKRFIKDNTKDFIRFKTELLSEDVGNDPIKKAGLIRDIVESIALIPDAITRSVYIKECSSILDMDEQTLLNELNKDRKRKFETKSKDAPLKTNDELSVFKDRTNTKEVAFEEDKPAKQFSYYEPSNTRGIPPEKDIIRILLMYGTQTIEVQDEGPITVCQLILNELEEEIELPFFHIVYKRFLEFFKERNKFSEVPPTEFFLRSTEEDVAMISADILFSQYTVHSWEMEFFLSRNEGFHLSKSPHALHDWERHGIYVQTEDMLLKRACLDAVFLFKIRRLEFMLRDVLNSLKLLEEENREYIGSNDLPTTGNPNNIIQIEELLQKMITLDSARKHFNKALNTA